ncbi:anoctamin-7-like [Salmo salar]|uniref:Anoctamin-7-like n=1 Tax=Salmo salar TaxID=8030 RepID=A0A1S3LJ32_SALSA|nr:anoctamin-7-like [Salmo salar]|eukprot:XP_013990850.1 PREDICTED: anoctamin-7-like [Salmo salar]
MEITLVYWELLAVRLGFIIAFEHVVFFFLQAIDWMVPNVSESLELKMKRERYLAKQGRQSGGPVGESACPGLQPSVHLFLAMLAVSVFLCHSACRKCALVHVS